MLYEELIEDSRKVQHKSIVIFERNKNYLNIPINKRLLLENSTVTISE